MTRMGRFVAIAAAAAGLAASGAGTSSAECIQAGGIGTGVTTDIATFMANKALANSIENWGGKPAGKASLKCESSAVVVTNCTASQRACK